MTASLLGRPVADTPGPAENGSHRHLLRVAGDMRQVIDTMPVPVADLTTSRSPDMVRAPAAKVVPSRVLPSRCDQF